MELPVYDNKPIILVPKNFVRNHLVYTYDRFYDSEMLPNYEREALSNPSSGLVKILKRGIVPARTKIRKKYPCLKNSVITYITEHRSEYDRYKFKQLNYIKEKNV